MFIIPDQPEEGTNGYGGKDFEKRKVLRRKKGKFSYATEEEDKTPYVTHRADSFKCLCYASTQEKLP